jgi:hypothetical protein
LTAVNFSTVGHSGHPMTPQKIVAQSTDWRVLRESKKELEG